MNSREIAQKPTYLSSNPASLTSGEWLAKAAALTRSSTFTKEDSAKFESFMALHAATRQDHFDREVYNTARQRRDAGLRFDAATLAFFSGKKTQREALASEGGVLETRTDQQRAAVTELRSYTALNTTTSGDAGGYTVPIGFLAEVLQQARQYDQLLDASRWIFTPSGGVLDLPAVDPTATDIDAVTLAELSEITQGPNPKFSNLQWPQATTWVTPQFVYSLQLEQDSPVLAMYFAELFAKSFARGMGKAFLATLLSGLSAGATTASPTAIVPGDIFKLMTAVDTAYATAPGSGFLMTWATYISIRQNATAAANVYWPVETPDGRPAIMGKPVYFCPNMNAIGAGQVPAIFGDLKRFAIRAVTDSFSSFRYDEKYMVNHQKAIQAYWRADGLLLKGGSSDVPMAVLQCGS